MAKTRNIGSIDEKSFIIVIRNLRKNLGFYYKKIFDYIYQMKDK